MGATLTCHVVMGVPALFKWLTDRYPRLTTEVLEEAAKQLNGLTIPVDTSKPNPNSEEFDNLYLDMNGIIHPCVHPEGAPAPETEEQMFIEVFKYIDRLFAIVRPRKVLYMAIDGVAPRAKMNQQRSRRFRAAREAGEKLVKEQELDAKEEALHASSASSFSPASIKAAHKAHFDTNAITPGTHFMADLAIALRYYVVSKLNTDPGWQGVQVFLSDASVPGEGEHKIMDFIRRQRTAATHDPNTHHVLYGLDADLIMLALASHEPHFKLIRENVFDKNKERRCYICSSTNHDAAHCNGEGRQKSGEFDEKAPIAAAQKFLFFHVNRLREYLAYEFRSHIAVDKERVIDDWVFMCLFVGNDFLPHLPSLEIREGAINRLMDIYRHLLPQMGGEYITDAGYVDLKKVEMVMTQLAEVEDQIFRERKEKEERDEERRKQRERQMKQASNRSKQNSSHMALDPATLAMDKAAVELGKRKREETASPVPEEPPRKRTEDDVSEKLEKMDTDSKSETAVATETSTAVATETSTAEAETIVAVAVEKTATPVPAVEEEEEDVVAESVDVVKLGDPGWRERYYRQKFGFELSDTEAISAIGKHYMEGICWVMRYYYQGCPSWKWFYPHHFAPFAEDFKGVSKMLIDFELGTPFNPLEQLMGVFPAASGHLVPSPFRKLMVDTESPIYDFYPTDFAIDMNGKKMAWQGVALLPFVEEKRLLDAMKQVYPLVPEDELALNVRGPDRLFVGEQHPLYESLCSLYGLQSKDQEEKPVPIDPHKSKGVAGTVSRDPDFASCLPGSVYSSPLQDRPDIEHSKAIEAVYHQQAIKPNQIFVTRLLRGANEGRPQLTSADLQNIGRAGRRGGNGGPGSHRGRNGGEYDVNNAPTGQAEMPSAYARNMAYNGQQRDYDRGNRDYDRGSRDYDRGSRDYYNNRGAPNNSGYGNNSGCGPPSSGSYSVPYGGSAYRPALPAPPPNAYPSQQAPSARLSYEQIYGRAPTQLPPPAQQYGGAGGGFPHYPLPPPAQPPQQYGGAYPPVQLPLPAQQPQQYGSNYPANQLPPPVQPPYGQYPPPPPQQQQLLPRPSGPPSFIPSAYGRTQPPPQQNQQR